MPSIEDATYPFSFKIITQYFRLLCYLQVNNVKMNNIDKRLTVGIDCLSKARNYALEENWRRAFPHYMMCLELFASERNAYEEEFVQVLFNLGNWLDSKNLYEELFKSYQYGLMYFPSNTSVLNNFGSHLLKVDKPETAMQYFKEALNLDEGFLLAEKNLETCKLQLIPRWHFRMLNDSKRNSSYNSAIKNAISPGYDKVVDIGSGCGLLTYFASLCPSVQQIYSIDSVSVLSDIAKKAFEGNEKINVINKHSTELSASDTDGLANCLITEIFDAGLFGEQALDTLIHAWENLLESSAKIVPSRAELFVTGISSDIILKRHKVFSQNHGLEPLRNVCLTQATEEPYEAENLRFLEVNFITKTQMVLKVNFDDVNVLKRMQKDSNFLQTCMLTCLNDGVLGAFVIWFDLYLDESTRITTNPTEEDGATCWEQAIIYLDHPVNVTKNQEIIVRLTCLNGRLNVCLDTTTFQNEWHVCFKVSQPMITLLNEERLINVANNLNLKNLTQDSTILDLNPFPIFAFLQLQKNQRGNYICLAKTDYDCEFIQHIGSLLTKGFESQTTLKIFTSIEEILNDLERKKCVDFLILDPISENGTISEEIFDNFDDLRTILKNDAVILPHQIDLAMEVVDSPTLDFCNKVNDDNLFGFKTADCMNEFAISEQWQIWPSLLRRKSVGNLVRKFRDFSNSVESLVLTYHGVQATCDANMNGILCWYNLKYDENLEYDTHDSFHYYGMCFLLDKMYTVKSGDMVRICFKEKNGLLKVCVDVNDG